MDSLAWQIQKKTQECSLPEEKGPYSRNARVCPKYEAINLKELALH